MNYSQFIKEMSCWVCGSFFIYYTKGCILEYFFTKVLALNSVKTYVCSEIKLRIVTLCYWYGQW